MHPYPAVPVHSTVVPKACPFVGEGYGSLLMGEGGGVGAEDGVRLFFCQPCALNIVDTHRSAPETWGEQRGAVPCRSRAP